MHRTPFVSQSLSTWCQSGPWAGQQPQPADLRKVPQLHSREAVCAPCTEHARLTSRPFQQLHERKVCLQSGDCFCGRVSKVGTEKAERIIFGQVNYFSRNPQSVNSLTYSGLLGTYSNKTEQTSPVWDRWKVQLPWRSSRCRSWVGRSQDDLFTPGCRVMTV